MDTILDRSKRINALDLLGLQVVASVVGRERVRGHLGGHDRTILWLNADGGSLGVPKIGSMVSRTDVVYLLDFLGVVSPVGLTVDGLSGHVALAHLHELLGSAGSAWLWWPGVALLPEAVRVGRAVVHLLAFVDEGRGVILSSTDGDGLLPGVSLEGLPIRGGEVAAVSVTVAGEPFVGVRLGLDWLGSAIALKIPLLELIYLKSTYANWEEDIVVLRALLGVLAVLLESGTTPWSDWDTAFLLHSHEVADGLVLVLRAHFLLTWAIHVQNL